MPEQISNMIRWNANFVRGLAESVLDRARIIRSTLGPFVPEGRRRVKAKAAKPRRARSRKTSN